MNFREISKRLCGCRLFESPDGDALIYCGGHCKAVMAAIEDPETSYPAVTRRRLGTARRALEVRVMNEPISVEDIDTRMEAISDGIRALQSLDDLGEEMIRTVILNMDELERRYEALKRAREKMPAEKRR